MCGKHHLLIRSGKVTTDGHRVPLILGQGDGAVAYILASSLSEYLCLKAML